MEPDEEDRELGSLLRRYEEHRNALRRLSASAPDGRIARRYERFIEDLSRTIDYLADLQRREDEADEEWAGDDADTDEVAPASAPVMTPPPGGEFETMNIKRWNEPLVHHSVPPAEESPAVSRRIPIAVVIIAVIALLSALIWWSAGDEPARSEVVAEQGPAPVVEETPPPSPLVVSPTSFDYGAVRNATRASHQFRISNSTDKPIDIQFERSSCRCLWYQPGDPIPPGGSGDVAITVDGSRVEPGPLHETVVLMDRENPEVKATIDLSAEIVERN